MIRTYIMDSWIIDGTLQMWNSPFKRKHLERKAPAARKITEPWAVKSGTSIASVALLDIAKSKACRSIWPRTTLQQGKAKEALMLFENVLHIKAKAL